MIRLCHPVIYAVLAGALTCLTGWLLALLIYLIVPEAIEGDDPWQGDPFIPWHVALLVLVLPLFENAVLVGVMKMLKNVIHSARWLCFCCAFIAATLHSMQAPAWFFPAFFSFAVLSASYLLWRRQGSIRAFFVIWLIHGANNLFAITPYYLFET
ncbi:hypothetical protein [Alteromonas halophila]|uniref:Uncharacterized protein n=1 Tax=Alteromonas halophila TaxID=516698 RepID=A0A918JQB5_9ALTE|nr:hypothetical protein [Alteromonas halophila]GGW95319.1 hypothetical protein GCM10007391_31990 [Alteromonas halophila]